MARPKKNLIPLNRVRCLVCGSAWQLGQPGTNEAAEYRAFLSEHRDCRILGVPAAGCVEPNCDSTAVGPMQKCKDHGGRYTRADVTIGGV